LAIPADGAAEVPGVEQIAFRINPGQAAAYKRRHDGKWPELVALLKAAGVADYSIFLDPDQPEWLPCRHAVAAHVGVRQRWAD
jgi:L-rhamnose mutarotase